MVTAARCGLPREQRLLLPWPCLPSPCCRCPPFYRRRCRCRRRKQAAPAKVSTRKMSPSERKVVKVQLPQVQPVRAPLAHP